MCRGNGLVLKKYRLKNLIMLNMMFVPTYKTFKIF